MISEPVEKELKQNLKEIFGFDKGFKGLVTGCEVCSGSVVLT